LVGAVLAVAGGGTYYFVRIRPGQEAKSDVKTVEVTRGPFAFSVTETGEVESSNSVEIRCEVKARNSSGTTILEIVPEGTFVEKGATLVKLDASALELELNAQTILVNSSEASMIQTENIYETAVIAKKEYEKGTFVQEEQTIQSEIFVAQETLRRAEEYLKYTERLFARGYVTQLQLEADRFAVEKAKNELAAANTKLQVLNEYTKTKMLAQLEADKKSAYANWQSAKSSYELDVKKCDDIKVQIDKCTILAPEAGQVKYNNRRSRRGDDEIIEAGVQVREGQVIIKLPDPDKMQVMAEISEDRTKHVKQGMTAWVVVDSVSKIPLEGRVVKVNDYPEPTSFFSSNVKKYETTIEILNPPAELRPGLTAKVTIDVAQLTDVVRVPLPSVVEHDKRFYAMLQSGGGQWQLREVDVGLHNENMVVIRSGLEASDVIAENPRKYKELVEWPQPSEKQSDSPAAEQLAGAKRGAPGPPPGENGGRPRSGGMMERLDANQDGKLSADEVATIPDPQRSRLMQADANQDGALDQAELAAARQSAGGRGGGQ
jgi:multidrug resistance efflux pump